VPILKLTQSHKTEINLSPKVILGGVETYQYSSKSIILKVLEKLFYPQVKPSV
jgi:hypothetical protein